MAKRVSVQESDKPFEHDIEMEISIAIFLTVLVGAVLIAIGRQDYFKIIGPWIAGFISALILTALTQSLLEKFTKGKLAFWFLNIRIGEKEYSISILIILVVVLKFVVFS